MCPADVDGGRLLYSRVYGVANNYSIKGMVSARWEKCCAPFLRESPARRRKDTAKTVSIEYELADDMGWRWVSMDRVTAEQRRDE